MRRIANKGTIKGFTEIPKSIQEIFVTSHDVTPEWHVKMQAAFQLHTDNAVSKTVNLCNEATKDDVREVFLYAYNQNCKGVTIYRDGSRDMQVLNIGKVKGKEEVHEKEINYAVPGEVHPRPRPDTVTGFTEKVKIGCGNLYVTANYDEQGICEVFTNTGRAGGCPSQSEATSRLVSIALRSGIEVKSIVEQLKGIRCPSTIRQKGLKVLSCPDAIGRLIEKVEKIQQGNENEVKIPKKKPEAKIEAQHKEILEEISEMIEVPVCAGVCASSPELEAAPASRFETWGTLPDDSAIISKCPECSTLVEHEGGCVVCRNCGFSKCG